MVYKYVSIYNVIEKLYRDYDHQEELDVWDVIEWGAEALEFIGAGQQYERRVAELKVENCIAVLPCNYHSQPIPSYLGSPLNLATGGFAPLDNGTADSTANHINGVEVSDDNFPLSGQSTGTTQTLNETFYIKDGVFVTSINSGTVILDYKAIATDKEGFPKIPDLISYRTAVARYIQMKLDHIDWRRKRIDVSVYRESKTEWQEFCLQARAAANMPNLAYAEAIKNQWVKLKPNQNSADSFYNTGTIREMRKLK